MLKMIYNDNKHDNDDHDHYYCIAAIVIVIMTIAGHDWNYDRGILGDIRLSALIAL